MQEIKCPNCGQVFQVDESGYAQIVQQVRDREFAHELERRAKDLEQQKEQDTAPEANDRREKRETTHRL